MILLAWIAAAVLLPAAALHLVWAFGIPWPFASERDLAHSVGGPSLNPKTGYWAKFAITVIAAGAILAAGVLPLIHAGVLPNPLPKQVAYWLLLAQTVAFLLRGGLGYVDVAPASAHEPFRTYNRRYFSPLIIVLGLICASLLILPSEM